MPHDTNALPLGYQLEEYRVESVLGTGGFGITYKARDIHLEAWVAIKEYFPIEWSYRGHDGASVFSTTQGKEIITDVKTSGYEWGLDRFLYEARVLASVQHAYVVRVRRYFRANGTAYIVMDYEEGEPLSALLRREEMLSEADIRGMLDEVLPALDAVHQKGYLHRDLKPSNLFIRARDSCVMLIDFGAARQSLGRHTKSITGLVTPGYSPPEQYLTRSDRYGPWTDIYALGAVLYRCITGKPPIEAPDRQMWDSMIPALEAGAGRYATDLLAVVDRALAMRPEDRFQSVAEMQGALAKPALDTPSRFSLVPKVPAGEKKKPVQPSQAEPLDDLFDLSTPPVSRPSRKLSEPVVSEVSGSPLVSYTPEHSHPVSLPSLSIFDDTAPPSPQPSSPAAVLSMPQAMAAEPVSKLPDAEEGPSAFSFVKPVSRRATLAQSARMQLASSPPVVEEEPEVLSDRVVEPKRKASQAMVALLVMLLLVGVFLLYRGYQEKFSLVQQEQLEAESRRQASEERTRREQEETRRVEVATLLEQVNKAMSLKDWVDAAKHLEHVEALQPGNLKVMEIRQQLREEQRRLGSLEVREDPMTGMKLVKLSPGCFQMGSPENLPERYFNEPPHQVCVKGFWMGQFEVTNGQFRRFKPAHDSGSFKGNALNGDTQPVVNVSWPDAVAFAEWMSQQAGKRYRLPTEAEWEYAARAGTTTVRYWGDDPKDACRYANVADETARRAWGAENLHECDDGQGVSATVGAFLPNAFKLYDLLGNVSEWICSEYEESNGIEEGRCSERKGNAGRRVVRGGTWDDAPKLVRAADRNGREPDTRDNDLGFRLVLEE